jgi:RNA polymerase sigma-70 factor (ECF subfamily)
MSAPEPKVILMSERTDEQLMSQFQQGDESAYSLLVRRYKDELTNFALRFLGDWDEAEDVVQETFVRVFRKKHAYRGVAKFSTWVYTIASNLAKSRLRRIAIRRFVRLGGRGEEGPEFDLPDDDANTDGAADQAMREQRIQEALGRLPAKFRQVVVLRDIQDLSYDEIVGITGEAMGTVKSRINRGRALMRDMLRDLIRD